jgi:hypothetical protein
VDTPVTTTSLLFVIAFLPKMDHCSSLISCAAQRLDWSSHYRPMPMLLAINWFRPTFCWSTRRAYNPF